MSGVYWGLSAMALMKKLSLMNKEEVLLFIDTCKHPNGGYSASKNHDPHLLYTLSAIQVQLTFCSGGLFDQSNKPPEQVKLILKFHLFQTFFQLQLDLHTHMHTPYLKGQIISFLCELSK